MQKKPEVLKTEMSKKRKTSALGKGLTALLSDSSRDREGGIDVNSIAEIEVDTIQPNPYQPREAIEDKSLADMVDSIKLHGIIQPVTVRKVGPNSYQLISGERRTRSAKLAGLNKIPAFVRTADDQSMLELALIENTHRENLNPIEIALSYKRLIEECNLKQDELAKRVSRNRSTVANFLRLLKLPEEIQIALAENSITVGHARALIGVEDKKKQIYIFQKAIKDGLSVRKVEEMVSMLNVEKKREKDEQKQQLKAQVKSWQTEIANIHPGNAKVRAGKGGKAEIVIPIENEQEFEKYLSYFK